MHTKTLTKRLLKIEKIVIEDVRFEPAEEEEILVVRARPMSRDVRRCPHCGRLSQGYDSSGKIGCGNAVANPGNAMPAILLRNAGIHR